MEAAEVPSTAGTSDGLDTALLALSSHWLTRVHATCHFLQRNYHPTKQKNTTAHVFANSNRGKERSM